MRAGELQTGKKRGKPSENALTMPFGNRRGRPVLFSRVSGRGVWDFSRTNILFFVRDPENNRRFQCSTVATAVFENRGRVDRVARRSRNRNARRHR